jgi:hypothetical protein
MNLSDWDKLLRQGNTDEITLLGMADWLEEQPESNSTYSYPKISFAIRLMVEKQWRPVDASGFYESDPTSEDKHKQLWLWFSDKRSPHHLSVWEKWLMEVGYLDYSKSILPHEVFLEHCGYPGFIYGVPDYWAKDHGTEYQAITDLMRTLTRMDKDRLEIIKCAPKTIQTPPS